MGNSQTGEAESLRREAERKRIRDANKRAFDIEQAERQRIREATALKFSKAEAKRSSNTDRTNRPEVNTAPYGLPTNYGNVGTVKTGRTVPKNQQEEFRAYRREQAAKLRQQKQEEELQRQEEVLRPLQKNTWQAETKWDKEAVRDKEDVEKRGKEKAARNRPQAKAKPVTCRTCSKPLVRTRETQKLHHYNGYKFTPAGEEPYYQRQGQDYFNCQTCFEYFEREFQRALQKGLQGGKKTVCKSRVVLVGHYGAGKTNLKRCLLKEDFIDQHVETDSIEADPSNAKVDITRTRGWRIHEVKDEYREVFTAYIVQQVLQPEQETTADPGNAATDVEGEGFQDMTEIKEDAEKRLQAELPDLDQFLVELFFWDFGGQSVYYNTHMTFLTSQSIYVVVMDMTKALTDKIPAWCLDRMGERIPDTSCPQTVADYLDYWCACIHTFVTPETKEEVIHGQVATPAIVIVGTHRDECTDAEAKHFEKQVKAYIATKPYSNQINQDIFTISNKNRDGDEIKKLQDIIVSLATMQSYDLPISWVKFKEEMNYRAGGVQWMRFAEAITIGHELGLDKSDVVSALSFFHGVGDVIYFNEETVREIIITEPQWLIEQFRKVITIPAYRDRFFKDSDKHWSNLYRSGVLHEAVLRNVWSRDVKDELIALMKRFALLCEITTPQLGTLSLDYEEIVADDVDHRLYLVPSLIGLQEQVLPQDTSVLPVFLTPSTKFVPIGLTSRLTVGLINEDEWQLVRVTNNSATFRPNGDDSDVDVCITITAMKDRIEVSGNNAGENIPDCYFPGCLDTVRHRLDAITSSVCPQQSFSVSIQCLVCKEKGKDVLMSPFQNEDEFSGSVYCRSHKKLWNIPEYSKWFQSGSAENPAAQVDVPHAAQDLRNVPLPDTLIAVLDRNRAALVQYITPGQVFDYLRQWKTLTVDEEDKIKLNNPRAEQVRQLLDLIRRKSHQDYINLKQALSNTKQDYIVKDILNKSEREAGIF